MNRHASRRLERLNHAHYAPHIRSRQWSTRKISYPNDFKREAFVWQMKQAMHITDGVEALQSAIEEVSPKTLHMRSFTEMDTVYPDERSILVRKFSIALVPFSRIRELRILARRYRWVDAYAEGRGWMLVKPEDLTR